MDEVLKSDSRERRAAVAGNGEGAPGRLLGLAAELFARKGYAGTSIKDLAHAAGISKSTVFHHFPSKRALYLAVIREAVARFGRTLGELDDNRGGVVERLAWVQRAHLEHIFAHRNVALIVLRELQGGEPGAGGELAAEVFSDNFARVVALLESGRADGVIRADVDCAVTAVMLLCMNVQYFQARDLLVRLPGLADAADPEWFVTRTLEVLLNGLLVRPATARPGRGTPKP